MDALEDFCIEASNSRGCLDEALPIRVLTDGLDDLPYGFFDSWLVYLSHRSRQKLGV